MEMNNLYVEGENFASDSGTRPYRQALILIAEDELEIVDILSAYLTRSNMRTIHASDGQRALELHASMKPDLILLDIQMPKMDGKCCRNFVRKVTPPSSCLLQWTKT